MKLDIGNVRDFTIDWDFEDDVLKAIDDAMPKLVTATKAAIGIVIRNPDKSTGSLVASVEATPAQPVSGGGYYAAIRFDGKGPNGTRNGLKAAELEYGNSNQDAAPFTDLSVAMCEGDIAMAVEVFLAKELKKAVEG